MNDILVHQHVHSRLSLHTRVWENATRRALEQIKLRAGSAALDVGCGSGDVMRLIAAQLGGRGRIIGMDIDRRLLEGTAAVLQAEQPGLYSFVVDDLMQRSVTADGEFDLVFARLLLLHITRPVEALQRLWARVRPQGVLMVMDYDLTTARSVPEHGAIERALRLVNGSMRRAGREIDIGTVMPSLFVEAGIGAPDACEVSSVLMGARTATRMLREVLNSLQPLILRARLVDAAALERVEAALLQSADSNQFIRWPDLVTTWKYKPP